MFTFAASVGDALLTQFKEYARHAVGKGDLDDRPAYDKVLQGLQVAAPQAGAAVLEQLLIWRGDTLTEVGASRASLDPSLVLRKRLVAEALFVEAVLAVLRADGVVALTAPQARELEALAFDWILHAEKYVDQRYPPLHRLRDRVVAACSRLLGALCPVALDAITDRFLAEVGARIKAEAGSPSRQELLQLCAGLGRLRLHADTPAQLRAATNFLERAHPLKHVAPDKKSRLQQAITDMLTSVLAPLADEGDPSDFGVGCDPELRKHWFATVAYLRSELLRWTGKQSKQAASGLPAVAALTCLEAEAALVASIDGLIEQLHRALKDRRSASMALLCLVRCVSCFLRRLWERSDRERLTKWVARSVGPAVAAAARGALPAPEQQELVRQLCAVVARQLPEYGVGGMILELLGADGSQAWEGPMTGLAALMTVLAEAPSRTAPHPPPLALPATAAALEAAVAAGALSAWATPPGASLLLLDVVKAGRSPLDAYAVPHLLPAVSAALGRLLGQCHALHGYSRLTTAARAAPDPGARDRLSALPVFVAVLQALPYVLPDAWPSGGGPADDLPGYTAHAEPSVRQAAAAALHRCVVALPAARDALVAGMAVFVVRLPDEIPQVIKDSAALLMALMAAWGRLAAGEAAAAAAEGWPPPPAGGAFPSAARVEGAGLGLLCSGDVEIRRLGVEVMRAARDLHAGLAARHAAAAVAGAGAFGAATAPARRSIAAAGTPEPPPQLVLPPHAVSRRSTSVSVSVSVSVNASGAFPPPTTSGTVSAAHVARRSTSSLPGLPPLAFTPGAASVAEAAAAAAAAGSSAPSTPGSAGDGVAYLFDIVERLGDDMARRCYWDFGRWSDLWRDWRPPPPGDATFRACLARGGGGAAPDDAARWARVLCELAREAWRRADRAAWAAHLETCAKLQALLSLDSAGRQVLPHDGPRGELARAYCLLAAAAPLLDAAQVGDRGLTTRDLVRLLLSSARAGVEPLLWTAVLALGCMDPSCHTLVAQEAGALAEDPGGGGGGGGRGGPLPAMGRAGRGGRREEWRLAHAHVMRVLAASLAPGALARSPALRERVVEFVAETARHVAGAADVTPELQQLRYCLCVVARQAAGQLAEAAPQAFPPMLRKQLFDKFSLFCEEGQTPGLFRSELRRSIAAARVKVRDPEHSRALEADIADASEALEHAAYLGMSAMLLGPLFDADAREPEGRVLSWVDRLLAAAGRQEAAAAAAAGLGGPALLVAAGGGAGWGPPREAAARGALRNLLRSNAELAPAFVDRAYSPAPQVAAAYFSVLADVYSAAALPLEQHVVVSLVLHKVVDPRQAVRDAARGMLGALARRCWAQDLRRSMLGLGPAAGGAAAAAAAGPPGTPGGSEAPEDGADGAVVVGSLAESHQAYQQHLSSRLAREHAELSHAVALEVLSRQQGGVAAGAEALLCLPPWLEYAALGGQWEGQWGGALLRALYRTTAAQGARRAYPVQKLWATVAENRRNVAPALDFLLRQGVAESAAAAAAAGDGAAPPPPGGGPCAVGKQVALYLSRVAPRQTIEALVLEALAQMAEGDPLAPARARRPSLPPSGGPATPQRPDASPGGGGWDRIREFHHQLEAAPPQQPLPRQQPLAAHAAAVVAAATAAAGSSKPLTPTSIALAIKRSTLDLIIKTGVAVADTVAVAGAAAVGSISASGLTTPGAVPRAPSASERASGRYAGAPAAPAPDPAAAAYAPPTSPRPQSPLEPPPPPPPPRAALTRPELALCLLSEIACERDEELRPHLAPLLHVAVLHADSACATVRLEACQLLQYLLYSLACKPLESQAQGAAAPGPAGDYARVSGVIGYLQSLGGEPLWPREQPTLAHPWVPSAGFVAAFVQLTVDCFCFDGALRERWSAEALKWACCAASRHAASRSHQVYAALGPRLSSSSATALLAALQKCLQNATPEGLDTAVELLCTLRVVLANTPPRKMLLYPHVLAACVALLNSSVVRVGELAAALLVQLLDAVDLSTAAAQQALMSVLPPDGEGEGGGGEDGGGGGGGGRGALPRRRSRGRLAHAAPDWESWPLGQGLLGGAPDVDEDLAGGPWLALQQLLVKALFQPDTEALALEAMAAVAQQVARAGAAGRLRPRATSAPASGRFTVRSLDQALAAGGGGGGGGSGGGKAGGGGGGIEAVLGSAEVGLAISLSAALPWLCVHVGGGALAAPCAAFLRASAGAAAAVGWRDLSFVLAALAAGPPPAPAGAASWLPDLMEVLCAALFPAHSRLAVQRLMEAAARGAPAYQAAALACLRAVFRVPGLDLGSPGWFAEGSGLVEALSGAVGGPMGPQVLEVLQAMAAFKDDVRGAPQWAEPAQLEWPRCLDALGECNKVCSEALRRVVAACPGSAELARAAGAAPAGGRPGSAAAGESPGEQLLPFLPHNWR